MQPTIVVPWDLDCMEQDKHPFEFGVGRRALNFGRKRPRSSDSMGQEEHSLIEKALDLEPDREGTARYDPVTWFVVAMLLAGVYAVAGKLGLLLAFVHASATAVWLPTGIALTAFLILGYRVWPGIF